MTLFIPLAQTLFTVVHIVDLGRPGKRYISMISHIVNYNILLYLFERRIVFQNLQIILPALLVLDPRNLGRHCL